MCLLASHRLACPRAAVAVVAEVATVAVIATVVETSAEAARGQVVAVVEATQVAAGAVQAAGFSADKLRLPLKVQTSIKKQL